MLLTDPVVVNAGANGEPIVTPIRDGNAVGGSPLRGNTGAGKVLGVPVASE
jgi:hypothetical protein